MQYTARSAGAEELHALSDPSATGIDLKRDESHSRWVPFQSTVRQRSIRKKALRVYRVERARDDRDIHIETYGAGRTVVLLHGVPSSPTDFRRLTAILSPYRRVLIPHLPGYGRTPPDLQPASLESVAVRLEERLLTLDAHDLDFVAFSGGAFKAVLIALRGRITVGKLILLAPLVGMEPDIAQSFRDVAAAAFSGEFDPRPSWLSRMAAPGLAERDPSAASAVQGWLEAAPMNVICNELVASADAPDLRPRLPELRCAALVFSGTADRAVPPPLAEQVARGIRNAQLRSIAGAGHALLLEAPDRVIPAILRFIAADTVTATSGPP